MNFSTCYPAPELKLTSIFRNLLLLSFFVKAAYHHTEKAIGLLDLPEEVMLHIVSFVVPIDSIKEWRTNLHDGIKSRFEIVMLPLQGHFKLWSAGTDQFFKVNGFSTRQRPAYLSDWAKPIASYSWSGFFLGRVRFLEVTIRGS